MVETAARQDEHAIDPVCGMALEAVTLAAGLLYPFFGLLLSPMIAAAMSLSSVSVIINALRLRTIRLEIKS